MRTIDYDELEASLREPVHHPDVDDSVYQGIECFTHIPRRMPIKFRDIDPSFVVSVLLNYQNIFPVNAASKDRRFWITHGQMDEVVWEYFRHVRTDIYDAALNYLRLCHEGKVPEFTPKKQGQQPCFDDEFLLDDIREFDDHFLFHSVEHRVHYIRQKAIWQLGTRLDKVQDMRFHPAVQSYFVQINPGYVNQK